MKTKICIKCNVEKNLDEFCKGKKYADGRRGTCKECHNEYIRKYHHKNKEKKIYLKRNDAKPRPAWKRHNMTESLWNQMLNKYQGLCHACKERPAYAIDHDHDCCEGSHSKCGKCIRGILCTQCNTSLGLLKDNKKYIIGLAEYIKSF
jgi:hypothetical protein